MAYLIASIDEDCVQRAINQARRAFDQGADLVEIRLDRPNWLLADLDDLGGALPQGRWIATCRSRAEGGQCDRSTAAREQLLLAAAERGAGWIDLEHATYSRPASTDSGSVGGAAGRILSAHFLSGAPEDPAAYAQTMGVLGGDPIVKLAWQCEDIRDNLTALELMRAAPGRRMMICMGEKGLLSRVLAQKFGAFGSFCASPSSMPTAAGQVSVEKMIDCFGWRRQTADTRLFGVIGCPVRHSLSPLLFNRLFQRDQIDGVYTPLRVDTPAELEAFLDACRARPQLGVRGFSVTVPHKTTALRWCGQPGDPLTVRIGAANTLVFDPEGVRAFNTDYAGAVGALASALSMSEDQPWELRVAVLGAGGVARAMVAGLRDRGCRIVIFNRSRVRAEELAAEWGCDARPWAERTGQSFDAVVNCTTVGMAPHPDASPVPAETLNSSAVVFDTVYNPIETRLLRDARAAGCRVIDGVEMFVRQAAAQYRLWTDRAADLGAMRHVVHEALDRPAGE